MATTLDEPRMKEGLNDISAMYMEGGAQPAAPSIINTNSKYLNSPRFRDTYAQIALRRNGPDLPSTYIIPMAAKAVAEVTDYAEYARLIEEEKTKNPAFAAWLEARRFTAFSKEGMAGYAEGTLGHAIWDFLVTTGYETDKLALANVEITNDIDYIAQRQGNIHDLEHLVTGFSPNAAGEVAVVWTEVTAIANYFSPKLAAYIYGPLTFLVTAEVQATSLHYPEVFPTYLDATRQAMAMGQALKRPLVMEPWEEMFDWQISDIQKHLGIVPGPGALWDWTTKASAG